MTYTTETLRGVGLFEDSVLSRDNSDRIIAGAIVIGLAALAAALVLTVFSVPPLPRDQKAPVAPKAIVPANPYGALASLAHSFGAVPIPNGPGYAADIALNAEPAPSPAAVPASPEPQPPQRAPELAQSVPLPPVRPSIFRPQANPGLARAQIRQTATQNAASNSVVAPDDRNFLEKFFNIPEQPSGSGLAYARSEDGAVGNAPASNKSIALPPYGSSTAVYDLAARTVYLPNGDRLEAHSGYGNRLDDPQYVNEKNLGATPPHVYDLALREQPFHGVQALRLIPVGGGNMYGRTGLLAHTYMLGPNGASNGCVSFKDYSKFLQAFLSGEIKQLVVVPHRG